jgi:HPt (histidine-containing phosphotransfer) domain-containing protein
MDITQSAQVIESQVIALKQLATQLDQTLKNQVVKNYFVRRATDLLDDVEGALRHGKSKDSTHAWLWFYMADFSLVEAERRLKHAQDMVAKFGADLEAIG